MLTTRRASLALASGGDNSSAFRKTTHQDRPNGLQSFACAEATNDNPWRLVTLPPPSPDVHPDLRPAGQKSLSPRFHRRCIFLSDSRFLSQFHGLREEHVKLKRIFGSLGCASRRAFFRLCRLLHNDTGAGCMKTLPVSYTAYAGCTRPLSFFFSPSQLPGLQTTQSTLLSRGLRTRWVHVSESLLTDVSLKFFDIKIWCGVELSALYYSAVMPKTADDSRH